MRTCVAHRTGEEIVEYTPGKGYHRRKDGQCSVPAAGADHFGEVQAWNVDTGQRVWTYNYAKSPNWGAMLATAGGLVFSGGTSDRKMHAFDAQDGQTAVGVSDQLGHSGAADHVRCSTASSISPCSRAGAAIHAACRPTSTGCSRASIRRCRKAAGCGCSRWSRSDPFCRLNRLMKNRRNTILLIAVLGAAVVIAASFSTYFVRDDSGGEVLWNSDEAYVFVHVATRGLHVTWLGYLVPNQELDRGLRCRSASG